MLNKVIKKTELCFTVPNERGVLATWTAPLLEGGINIEAMCAYEQGHDTASFRFIASDNVKAKDYLVKKGYKVTENDVVCWHIENKPGMLNKVTSKIAEAGINFTCTYAGGLPGGNESYVVFCSDNPAKVETTINNLSL